MVKGKVRQTLRHKFGDTLVEVTLAIGIFSMVAIAAVSVVSASTSGTQNMLENTVTREEIDAQAEALRFIQAAYSASGEEYNEKDETKGKYALLWSKLNDLSLDPKTEANENIIAKMTDNSPTTCNELYTTRTETIDTSVEDVCPIGETCDSNTTTITNNITIPAADKAFIINTRALGASVSNTNINDDVINNIIVSPSNENNKKEVFRPAATFPRLIYGDDTNTSYYDDSSNLISGSNQLAAAEGLYILGVKDGETTTIVQEDGTINKTSAYIDFHIRSCWFATGATRPSTISTVIRLYNPDNVAIDKPNRNYKTIMYESGEDAEGSSIMQLISGNKAILIKNDNHFKRDGYTFIGWKDGSGNNYLEGAEINISSENITLYPIWAQYIIRYNSPINDTDVDKVPLDTNCSPTEGCDISSEEPVYLGHQFKGWCSQEVGLNSECSGDTYQPGDHFPADKIVRNNIFYSTTTNLYGMWEVHPDTVFLLDSTGSMRSMIDNAKSGIKRLATQTLNLGGKVALYDYRDAGVDSGYSNPKLRCGFGTCTSGNITDYVNEIGVDGGGDEAESVLSALLYIMQNTEWSVGYSKVIVIVTDASCHNPDKGVSYDDVINYAQNIAPISFYVVTNSGYTNYSIYKNLAENTGGKIVTNFSGLDDTIVGK